MKILKIKKQYVGLTFTRLDANIGCNVTFNTLTTSAEYYKNFYTSGFDHLFDVIEVEEVEDVVAIDGVKSKKIKSAK